MEKEQLKKISTDAKGDADEVSSLYRDVMNSKPLYSDDETALAGVRKQLEVIAADAGMSVEEFLKEAHTTSNYTSEHATALQLERAIGFFLSKR